MNSAYLGLAKLMFLALLLSLIPLAGVYFMPLWLLLFFVYWMIYSHQKKPAFTALIVGVLFDVAGGDLLGQNALALILSSLFILRVRQSFYFSNITTQQIYLLVSSLIYMTTMYLSHMIYIGILYVEWRLLITVVITALIWPLIVWLSAKIYKKPS